MIVAAIESGWVRGVEAGKACANGVGRRRDFRHGGRSARGLEVRRDAPTFCVMAEWLKQ
jgi:hypothetical protein